jgi:cell division protease FtsH
MQTAKTVVFWAVIIVSAFVLWQVARTGSSAPAEPEVSYTDFLARIDSGQVSKVTIAGNIVHAQDTKGGRFRVVAPANQTVMMELLQQKGAEIWLKDTPEGNWSTWLMNLAPLILLGALWFFMIRGLRKAGRSRSPEQDPGSRDTLNQTRPGP